MKVVHEFLQDTHSEHIDYVEYIYRYVCLNHVGINNLIGGMDYNIHKHDNDEDEIELIYNFINGFCAKTRVIKYDDCIEWELTKDNPFDVYHFDTGMRCTIKYSYVDGDNFKNIVRALSDDDILHINHYTLPVIKLSDETIKYNRKLKESIANDIKTMSTGEFIYKYGEYGIDYMHELLNKNCITF